MIPPCTRKSLVYENVCSTCNPGADAKKELENVDPTIPSIYVGETARTIQERAKEHWSAARGRTKKDTDGSHMWKHMEQYHGGGEPTFIMRVVQFHRSALSRQTGEAVRIMRRGGAGSVLNSRSEFNRCYIPRLKVEEQDKLTEMEEQEKKELESVKETLRVEDLTWEKGKRNNRRAEVVRSSLAQGKTAKRSEEQQGAGRRRKRFKYDIVEDDWGGSREGKTTKSGAITELEVVLVGAVSTEGAEHLQSEGATELLTDRVSDRAPLATVSPPVDDEVGNTGTARQLYSPRCVYQTSISDYCRPMGFDTIAGGGGKTVTIGMEDKTPSDEYQRIQITPDVILGDDTASDYKLSTTPSIGDISNLNKEDVSEGDICSMKGVDQTKNECDINKKRLWCNNHDCVVKSMDVSSKKWQWNVKKMKYMYVYRKVKKYVCPGMRVSQVQLMVESTLVEKQTKPEPVNVGGDIENQSYDTDYSGAMGGGSVMLSISEGSRGINSDVGTNPVDGDV